MKLQEALRGMKVKNHDKWWRRMIGKSGSQISVIIYTTECVETKEDTE